MRILKKLYSDDERTLAASRLFDEVIRSVDLPYNFELLEFSIGHGFTHIDNKSASIGIELEPWLDRDGIKTAITFELYRIFARKKAGVAVPGLIEDVLVGRDMARTHAKDLTNLFCAFIANNRAKDFKDYLRLNVPWLVFHGVDAGTSDILKGMVHGAPSYGLKSRKLFNAMKKDLWDDKNMTNAVNAWEGIANAGN